MVSCPLPSIHEHVLQQCQHTHTHTYAHTHVCTRARARAHTHTHTYAHIYTHVYTHLCTHTHTYARTHIHTHKHTHAHTDIKHHVLKSFSRQKTWQEARSLGCWYRRGCRAVASFYVVQWIYCSCYKWGVKNCVESWDTPGKGEATEDHKVSKVSLVWSHLMKEITVINMRLGCLMAGSLRISKGWFLHPTTWRFYGIRNIILPETGRGKILTNVHTHTLIHTHQWLYRALCMSRSSSSLARNDQYTYPYFLIPCF